MKKFVLLILFAAFVVPAIASLTSWTLGSSEPNSVDVDLATIQLTLIGDDLVVKASDVASGPGWTFASFALIDSQERPLGTAVALPSAGPFAYVNAVSYGNQFDIYWDGLDYSPVDGDWFVFAAPTGIAVGDVFDILVYDLDLGDFTKVDSLAVVPEPVTAALLCLGAVGLLRKRK